MITAGATSGVVHNRLTHTIKVTAVARAIAVRLLRTEDRDLLRDLGGLDHVVVQAAANAHDLGHPPFGHLGERVLDRLARERFGLSDGFEGNAQTFRILTELEVHGPGDVGLNLTAAVRAAVLKYPWARLTTRARIPRTGRSRRAGPGTAGDGQGAAKFSSYLIDLPEMLDALRGVPRPAARAADPGVLGDGPGRRHRLLPARRRGLPPLGGAAVLPGVGGVPLLGERSGGARRAGRLSSSPGPAGSPGPGWSGSVVGCAARDGWIFDEDTFAAAVATVGDEFVDGVLATPYDGSMVADRADLRLHLALDRPPDHLGQPATPSRRSGPATSG